MYFETFADSLNFKTCILATYYVSLLDCFTIIIAMVHILVANYKFLC